MLVKASTLKEGDKFMYAGRFIAIEEIHGNDRGVWLHCNNDTLSIFFEKDESVQVFPKEVFQRVRHHS